MSQYFQWLILSSITGRPLLSAVALLAFWIAADRFALGVLPNPFRWVTRLTRESQLKRTLAHNPHDGRARLELAELLVQRRAYVSAIETLKPNLEKGDGDVHSLFIMGSACLGAGYAEQGEKMLAHARELDPAFRVGEIDLVLGKARLRRRDVAGALQALRQLVTARRGTIEGRVLLASALRQSGDDASAALMRDEAWKEYVAAPSFQRRRERLWAWRARPSRPITYLVVALLIVGTCTRVAGPMLAPLNDEAAEVDE